MSRLPVLPTPEGSIDYIATVEEADYFIRCIDDERAHARLTLKELEIDKESLISHRMKLYREQNEQHKNS